MHLTLPSSPRAPSRCTSHERCFVGGEEERRVADLASVGDPLHDLVCAEVGLQRCLLAAQTLLRRQSLDLRGPDRPGTDPVYPDLVLDQVKSHATVISAIAALYVSIPLLRDEARDRAHLYDRAPAGAAEVRTACFAISAGRSRPFPP